MRWVGLLERVAWCWAHLLAASLTVCLISFCWFNWILCYLFHWIFCPFCFWWMPRLTNNRLQQISCAVSPHCRGAYRRIRCPSCSSSPLATCPARHNSASTTWWSLDQWISVRSTMYVLLVFISINTLNLFLPGFFLGGGLL